MSNASEPKTKSIHNTFLTISLVVNIILAIFSGYSAFQRSELEDEKTKIEIEKAKVEQARQKIEQELFIEKNTPHLSTFYLITRIEFLYDFLKNKEPFPFAQQVEKYRILDNTYTVQLSNDIDNLRKNRKAFGSIHFLVIVNSEGTIANDLRLTGLNGEIIETGNVEPHTALLVPISYDKSTKLNNKISPVYTSLQYNAKAGSLQKQFTESIKAPVNPSWLPTLGNTKEEFISRKAQDKLRGWGRAKPKNDDKHLEELIPK